MKTKFQGVFDHNWSSSNTIDLLKTFLLIELFSNLDKKDLFKSCLSRSSKNE